MGFWDYYRRPSGAIKGTRASLIVRGPTKRVWGFWGVGVFGGLGV